jgi:hypothetical protein
MLNFDKEKSVIQKSTHVQFNAAEQINNPRPPCLKLLQLANLDQIRLHFAVFKSGPFFSDFM